MRKLRGLAINEEMQFPGICNLGLGLSVLLAVHFVGNSGNQPYTTSGLAITRTLSPPVFYSLEHHLFGPVACCSTLQRWLSRYSVRFQTDRGISFRQPYKNRCVVNRGLAITLID